MTEIHLSERDMALIEKTLESCAYDTVDEVVAAGLRRLESDEEKLRELVADADAQLDRGEYVAFTSADAHAASIIERGCGY